jgi:hypothetical protein
MVNNHTVVALILNDRLIGGLQRRTCLICLWIHSPTRPGHAIESSMLPPALIRWQTRDTSPLPLPLHTDARRSSLFPTRREKIPGSDPKSVSTAIGMTRCLGHAGRCSGQTFVSTPPGFIIQVQLKRLSVSLQGVAYNATNTMRIRIPPPRVFRSPFSSL